MKTGRTEERRKDSSRKDCGTGWQIHNRQIRQMRDKATQGKPSVSMRSHGKGQRVTQHIRHWLIWTTDSQESMFYVRMLLEHH